MTVCHHHPYTPTHLPEGAGRLVGVAVLQDVCQPAASRSGSVVRPMDLTQYDPSVRGNGGIADSSPDSRPRPGGLSVKGMSYITEPTRLLVAGRPRRARMPALIIVVYAAAVYLFFLAVLGYAAGFFAGFGVPTGIDRGPRR